jgi:signal transduction histidine kinase
MTQDIVPARKREEWAGRIVRNLDRLEELYVRLDELHEESKSRGERYSLALAVDCGCRRALNRVRHRGCEPRLDLQLEVDPLVMGNGQQLSRAVAVFVENAVEADPERTATVRLVREPAVGWSLSISDRGPGIAKEDRRRYGAAFFSHKEGRVGMGACLGVSLLERLGMSFDLTTDPHRGTSITIQPRRGR